MTCAKCNKQINEIDFHINCSSCGDFCDEGCFMKYHDSDEGCVKEKS